MQQHIDQAEHNLLFHDSICKQFPDDFYDWKITVLFYVAIHHIKALAASKKIDIGDSHEQIGRNLKRGGSMPIKEDVERAYRNLKNYSNTARYSGITDPLTFQELMKRDYTDCLVHFNAVVGYVAKTLPTVEFGK